MKTTLLGVFGNPILHSKSPQLFNSVFSKLNINAYYTRIRPQSAAEIIDIIRTMPLAGANITAPYKEQMLSLVDEVSIDAKTIGAINTIANCNGKLIGYNTDHIGVTESIKEVQKELTQKKCLVLGGGGAARSAAYGLKRNGAEVFICNRTHSKAKTIATDFACQALSWTNFDVSKEFDIVVSTLLPNAKPYFMGELKFEVLLDASYKPTLVSEITKSRGITIISGKRWLLYQAVEAFTVLQGFVPPTKTMDNALDKELIKNEVRIMQFPCKKNNTIDYRGVDLIISTKYLEQQEIKNITNEEISKTFAG